MPETSITLVSFALRLLLSLAVVAAVLIAYRIVRNATKRLSKDPTQLYSTRVRARNLISLAGLLIIALIWFSNESNLATAIGIFAAGVVIASQKMIGSFTAGLDTFFGGVYSVGDRVQIGEVVGDVVDINLLRTTLMEVGE